MNQPVLRIQNVSKFIKKRRIIKEMTLEINKGEVFGLLGPNGAGKTSLIRMIVGLTKISSGSIFVDGYDVKKNFLEAINCIGAIIEAPEVYKHLSGMDNMKIFARMYKKIDENYMKEIIDVVGMSNRINDKVRTYSLGMRQRLGICIAMMNNPKVLILDEPTNGLDPEGIHEIREYLRNIAHNLGITVVVSSHLLSEMELMCDRFAIISNGQLIDVSDMSQKEDIDSLEYSFDIGTNEGDLNSFYSILGERELKHYYINKRVVVSCDKNMSSELNKKLVEKNIPVYTIAPKEVSLEAYFLNKVGNNQIV